MAPKMFAKASFMIACSVPNKNIVCDYLPASWENLTDIILMTKNALATCS